MLTKYLKFNFISWFLSKVKNSLDNSIKLTHDDVISIYQRILGRAPEDEKITKDKMNVHNTYSLMNELIGSEEFKTIISDNQNAQVIKPLIKAKGIFLNNNDIPLVFPSQDRAQLIEVLTHGGYQFSEFKTVIKYLSENNLLTGSLFIDIGANVGTHTIYALKEREFSQAISIEPSVDNREFLKFNLILNQIEDKVKIIPVGLGDKNIDGNLVKNPQNCGDYRIEPKNLITENLCNEDQFITETIKIVTLDSMFESYGIPIQNIGFIWIDTQGSEGLILGSSIKIHETKCPIYIEFWPYGMNRLNSYEPLKKFIQEHVSVIVRFNKDEKLTYSPSSIDEIYNEFNGTDGFCDLLLLRNG